MIKNVHPFPARMAPEIALNRISGLKKNAVILDPMSGSGTVLRHAAAKGHRAIGFDLDPLAVLMSRVWTSTFDKRALERMSQRLNRLIAESTGEEELCWIDADPETNEFVSFWFARKQRSDLRRIAYGLGVLRGGRLSAASKWALDVLQLALSRIIVTKESGASLARDVSHSRPHKVADESDYDVLLGYERSVRQLLALLEKQDLSGEVDIRIGDARAMKSIENNSIDFILTSPPYLNAIDYMRGHRLALVWLGYSLRELRSVRSSSIGAERAADDKTITASLNAIADRMVDPRLVSSRDLAMIQRYSVDLYRLMSETSRVLNGQGSAVFVIGNSCLKGQYIANSEGLVEAGRMVGLELTERTERELPPNRRYLPMPESNAAHLGKRMRSEIILEFQKN